MFRLATVCTLLLSLIALPVASQQDCTLGIGGKDTELIVQVFQLNEAQQQSMETWIGELQQRRRPIQEKLNDLLENHPQSTENDLYNLSRKYKALQEEIVALSTSYDQKLLALFNDKQYARYLELCNEVLRKPMKVTRNVEQEEEEDPER